MCSVTARLALILSCLYLVSSVERSRQDEGYPVGFLSECPGSTKDTTIPIRFIKEMFFLVHTKVNGLLYKKRYGYTTAVENFTSDSNLDLLNRKTVLFISGFMDSTVFPFASMVDNAYFKKNYNVLLFDATRMMTYPYPVSARLVRAVGKKVFQVIIELYQKNKLNPKNLELLGFSLGAHISGFLAKHFYKATGKKISRLTGLDPAGPCFRRLGPDDRLHKDDCDFVDIVHTNIEGYGMAGAIGHVDFYVNGGEFQIHGFAELPCLMTCSHLRAIYIWVNSMEFPDKFIAMKCDTLQQVRDKDCYGRKPQETAVVGLKLDKRVRGMFYLATGNVEPYYMGSDGLVKEKDGYHKVMAKFNKDDNLILI